MKFYALQFHLQTTKSNNLLKVLGLSSLPNDVRSSLLWGSVQRLAAENTEFYVITEDCKRWDPGCRGSSEIHH